MAKNTQDFAGPYTLSPDSLGRKSREQLICPENCTCIWLRANPSVEVGLNQDKEEDQLGHNRVGGAGTSPLIFSPSHGCLIQGTKHSLDHDRVSITQHPYGWALRLKWTTKYSEWAARTSASSPYVPLLPPNRRPHLQRTIPTIGHTLYILAILLLRTNLGIEGFARGHPHAPITMRSSYRSLGLQDSLGYKGHLVIRKPHVRSK